MCFSCSSPVGYRYGRKNDVSLARGCWTTGIVMHEIGHSIGTYLDTYLICHLLHKINYIVICIILVVLHLKYDMKVVNILHF